MSGESHGGENFATCRRGYSERIGTPRSGEHAWSRAVCRCDLDLRWVFYARIVSCPVVRHEDPAIVRGGVLVVSDVGLRPRPCSVRAAFGLPGCRPSMAPCRSAAAGADGVRAENYVRAGQQAYVR